MWFLFLILGYIHFVYKNSSKNKNVQITYTKEFVYT